MSFILFLFCFILLVWVITLDQKISKLSSSVDYLLKTLSKDTSVKSEPKPTPEPIIEARSTEPVPEKAPVEEQKSIKVDKIEQVIVNPEKSKENFELQNAFLGNIFNKVGAVAIIIAVVIFAKLVSPYIVITSMMKFVLGVIAGGGMVLGGLCLHKKDKMKNYSEVLLGTGFATLFITVFCGYSLFNILNTMSVFFIGAILLLVIYLISHSMKTPSMLIIGLIGGYLTPCFSGGSHDAAFSYLIFLNLISLIYTLQNKKYSFINIINLVITMLVLSVSNLMEPIKIIFPLVLWGIYIVYDLLRDKSDNVSFSLSLINYIALTLFSLVYFREAHTSLGCLLAVTAAVYYILAFFSYKTNNELYKTYAHYVLINVWFVILFLLNDIQSVVMWSLVPLCVSFMVAKFNRSYLKGSVIAYYMTAFAGALLAQSNGEFCFSAQYFPILNIRTLIFAIPVGSMFISSCLMKSTYKTVSEFLKFISISLAYLYVVGEVSSLLLQAEIAKSSISFNQWMLYIIIGFAYALNTNRLYKLTKFGLFNVATWIVYAFTILILIGYSYYYPEGFLPILNLRFAAYVMGIAVSFILAQWNKIDFFKYLAVILGFVLAHCESVGISRLYENMSYIISLVWILYSGGITIAGILLGRKYLINSGICIVILTILRIFIFDLAKVDALYKLIAFLALGIILMLVSYIYTTRQKRLK
ncbi:DUF2339 domain-containing protein [bacterium]|nr:DUF2339 domain-containing protein [bacterium]